MKHKVKRVHFVGIGGAGMSGIAEVLLTQGYQVSGSDVATNVTTRRLACARCADRDGAFAENIAGADVVVVSDRRRRGQRGSGRGAREAAFRSCRGR